MSISVVEFLVTMPYTITGPFVFPKVCQSLYASAEGFLGSDPTAADDGKRCDLRHLLDVAARKAESYI